MRDAESWLTALCVNQTSESRSCLWDRILVGSTSGTPPTQPSRGSSITRSVPSNACFCGGCSCSLCFRKSWSSGSSDPHAGPWEYAACFQPDVTAAAILLCLLGLEEWGGKEGINCCHKCWQLSACFPAAAGPFQATSTHVLCLCPWCLCPFCLSSAT